MSYQFDAADKFMFWEDTESFVSLLFDLVSCVSPPVLKNSNYSEHLVVPTFVSTESRIYTWTHWS